MDKVKQYLINKIKKFGQSNDLNIDWESYSLEMLVTRLKALEKYY